MNQRKNLAHFTSLSKKPRFGNFNYKYPTSIPSPKDSSRKIITNMNSPNTSEEIMMMKKTFLNKSKDNESKSSYITYASPLNKYYQNNKKKNDINMKNKLILTLNNISNSKDKIMSYLNEKGKKSLSMTKNENLSHRVQTKTNTNSSNNLLGNKVDFQFHYPKSSISYNNTINKNNFASSAKQLSESYSLLNKKNNFFQSNIALYNKNININFLEKYLKTNQSRKNNNNLAKKPLFIHSIDFSSNNNFHKNKKIISTTTRQSPRKSLANFNSISSRVNKVVSKNLFTNKVVKNIKSNSCENNYCVNTNLKSTSVDKNIESNLHNIQQNRSKKIASHSQKEIDSKQSFNRKYTTNNSPNKTNNYLNYDDIYNGKRKKDSKNPSLKKNNIKKENFNNKISQIMNLLNTKNNINKFQKTTLTKKNLGNKNISNSTEATSNFNGNSFFLESLKLSSYIKSYHQKNNIYPETLLTFYKYGRIIGQGAFGKVNLGLNVLSGRVVAIKSFNKQSLDNENKRKIFYETGLMKQLNHPNVTRILELFETEKYILLIMEYINGGNLFSFVKKRRKLSEKTSKFLFKQIILGIKYIHSMNIVHRDIKLENILIDIKNNIKICDFGISKILTIKNQKLYDQCGTPMYMAPEIFLSNKEKGYDPYPIDLWSAGIALYIMLSGTLPFSAKGEVNEKEKYYLRNAIINAEFKPVENISDEALDLLNGLLRKDPKKRFKVNDVLNHPWMKNNNNNNYHHLFTKAELSLMSKTYIDYRFAKIEDIKETFTMSNLNNDEVSKEEINRTTKSNILAPYNTIKQYTVSYDDDFSDKNTNNVKLENDILFFCNKVKEYNRNYEINNNGECDNGILINTKTSNSVNSSIFNNSINIHLNDNFDDDDKKGDFYLNKEDEEKKKKKIIRKIEEMGYDKNYILEKINHNELCHVTAIYFLMMNYEDI